jgi:hypothetical protein
VHVRPPGQDGWRLLVDQPAPEASTQLHSMDEERWSVAAIATAIGRTPRYVQQRIAIVR